MLSVCLKPTQARLSIVHVFINLAQKLALDIMIAAEYSSNSGKKLSYQKYLIAIHIVKWKHTFCVS